MRDGKKKKKRVTRIKPGIYLEHATHQHRGEAEMIQTSSWKPLLDHHIASRMPASFFFNNIYIQINYQIALQSPWLLQKRKPMQKDTKALGISYKNIFLRLNE